MRPSLIEILENYKVVWTFYLKFEANLIILTTAVPWMTTWDWCQMGDFSHQISYLKYQEQRSI